MKNLLITLINERDIISQNDLIEELNKEYDDIDEILEVTHIDELKKLTGRKAIYMEDTEDFILAKNDDILKEFIEDYYMDDEESANEKLNEVL